jgi:hypothetical protein
VFSNLLRYGEIKIQYDPGTINRPGGGGFLISGWVRRRSAAWKDFVFTYLFFSLFSFPHLLEGEKKDKQVEMGECGRWAKREQFIKRAGGYS